MKSTSLIVCISLALSSAALAQQSTAVQGSVSGNAGASASVERNGANEGSAIAATEGASTGLAQGAEFNATLNKPIDARKTKVGDQVTATLNEDVESDSRVVIRKGAKLAGHVTAVRPLSRAKGSAGAQGDSQLAIVFDKAVLNDGREVPLNATVQALAAAQSHTWAAGSHADSGLGAAGGAAGSARSNGGGLIGGVAGGATGALGGISGGAGGIVNTGASASAGALAKSSGAIGGLDATGRLAAGSRGVFGLNGIDIAPATHAHGSVLTSSTRNVQLDRGVRMLLVNGSASGSTGAALSKGAPATTAGAAGEASGTTNDTHEAAPNAAPAREPVDRR